MRFIIGIDLGTTNCAVSFVDTDKERQTVELFPVPQLTQNEQIEERPTLPSFCVLEPAPSVLSWSRQKECVVGDYAKEKGFLVPTRVVDSAKSWLCLSGADRRDNILPFIAENDEAKISPVAATAAYLAHIRDAWNLRKGKNDAAFEFCEQQIILTVPASFDEVARELTFEAATKAGLKNITLLEEPQSAFYSWISRHEDRLRSTLKPGQTVLVCDVGGGTTDFSWIDVTEAGFRRMAVGRHLLLGGDNMDRAIAHVLEAKLNSTLTRGQWHQLIVESRRIKEKALQGEEELSVCLQGSGASVVGGSLTCTISGGEICSLLLSGFWRWEPWDQAPILKKGSGFRSFGLPYEDEPSILKHLASFLREHNLSAPDALLFNGGAMKPKIFQEAVATACSHWFGGKRPQVLDHHNLDLSVAKGAAYYGKARRGMGVKIAGGVSRNFYIEVNEGGEKKIVTLVPRDAEEEAEFDLPHTFTVIPNTPVSFRLYSSRVRLGDKLGDFVVFNEEELQPLPPLHTTIRFGTSSEPIPVHVVVRLTPIGTLEIWLKSQSTEHKWKLEFQIQSVSGSDVIEEAGQHLDYDIMEQAGLIITSSFCDQQYDPKEILPRIEALTKERREEWSPSVLRGLWPSLFGVSDKRGLSSSFNMRWWHLAGTFLRPGFGVALDDHRMKQLWKVILSDYREPHIHQWICYRRISGGLNKGQQRQIASELLKQLLDRGKLTVKSKKDLYPYSEKIRALASFDYLDIGTKTKLGHALVQRIVSGKGVEADFWALGRIGARTPLYGSVVDVVPKEIVQKWILSLLESEQVPASELPFLLKQLAEKTPCREVNLDAALIENVQSLFPSLVLTAEKRTSKEQERLFGERLPNGLMLSRI